MVNYNFSKAKQTLGAATDRNDESVSMGYNNDTVICGFGKDTITASGNGDVIDGGNGAESVSILGNNDVVNWNGISGHDTLTVGSGNHALTINLSNGGYDSVDESRNSGNDTISSAAIWSQASYYPLSTYYENWETIIGGTGHTAITLYNSCRDTIIDNGKSTTPDTITITGMVVPQGHDTIMLNGNSAIVDLTGTRGHDSIDASRSTGTETISIGGYHHTIHTLSTTVGGRSYIIESQDINMNTIIGGHSSSSVNNITLDGDSFTGSGSTPGDTGSGRNTIDCEGGSGSITVIGDGGNTITAKGSAGHIYNVNLTSPALYSNQEDDTVSGTYMNCTLSGAENDNSNGENTVSTWVGNDTTHAGHDTIHMGFYSDTIHLQGGNNELDFVPMINGGSNSPNITGFSQGDSIILAAGLTFTETQFASDQNYIELNVYGPTMNEVIYLRGLDYAATTVNQTTTNDGNVEIYIGAITQHPRLT